MSLDDAISNIKLGSDIGDLVKEIWSMSRSSLTEDQKYLLQDKMKAFRAWAFSYKCLNEGILEQAFPRDLGWKMHSDKNIVKGVFWYNIFKGEMDYAIVSPNTDNLTDHHSGFMEYDTYFNGPRGWIRGRYGVIGDKEFVMIYPDDFPYKRVGDDQAEAILKSVSQKLGHNVYMLVDDHGNSLLQL